MLFSESLQIGMGCSQPVSSFVRDVVSIFTFSHFPVVLAKVEKFVERFIGAFCLCVFCSFWCCLVCSYRNELWRQKLAEVKLLGFPPDLLICAQSSFVFVFAWICFSDRMGEIWVIILLPF